MKTFWFLNCEFPVSLHAHAHAAIKTKTEADIIISRVVTLQSKCAAVMDPEIPQAGVSMRLFTPLVREGNLTLVTLRAIPIQRLIMIGRQLVVITGPSTDEQWIRIRQLE